MTNNEINKEKSGPKIVEKLEKRPGSCNWNFQGLEEIKDIIDGIIEAQMFKQQIADNLAKEAKGKSRSVGPSDLGVKIKDSFVEKLRAENGKSSDKGR